MASKNHIPNKTEINNWEWFAAHQLVLDFDNPTIGSNGFEIGGTGCAFPDPHATYAAHPAALIVDQVYLVASDSRVASEDWDDLACRLSEIVRIIENHYLSEDL